MVRSPNHYRRRTWGVFKSGEEELFQRPAWDPGPPRYCKRCKCKLNGYNRSDRCLPCQRYVIVNPEESA